MKKKMVAVLLSVCIASTLFTGCGNSASTDAPDNTEETEAAPEAETETESQSAEAETPAAEAGDASGEGARYAQAYGYDLDLDPSGSLQGQYAGKEISVFCCTGEFSEPLQESIDAFQELSGAKVNLYVYSWDELGSKIALALAGDETMDVACFVSAYMNTYSELGQLADLTELSKQYGSEDYNWDGFEANLMARTSSDGKVYAIPYQICEMMEFYRKDIIEDPDVQAAYKEATGKDLTVPTTTEELAEVAAYFTKSLNADSPTEYGFASQNMSGAALWNWMARLGSYNNTALFDDEWNFLVNNDGGVESLEFAKSMLQYGPSNYNEYGFDELNNLMNSKELFLYEDWSSAYPYINTGDLEGKIGCVAEIGGSPVISGWSLGINALSEEQELAWKFVEFCTSEDGEMTRVDNGVSPARTANIERLIAAGEDEEFYNTLVDCFAAENTMFGDVSIPYQGSLGTTIIDEYVASVYAGSTTAKDALAGMEKDLDAALEAVGY